MESGSNSNTGTLTAYTLVPEANSSYLYSTGHLAVADPLSSSTVGFMMFLSAFQFQSPYVNQTYSYALSEAGKAAFVQSGGKKIEDGYAKDGRNQGLSVANDVGINETEAVILFGGAKAFRYHELNINGPKIDLIRTHLTLSPDSGSFGIRYEW